MKKIAFGPALLPALLLSACALFGPQGEDLSDLQRHRSQWQRQGIDTYEYDLTAGCFCPSVGPVHVLVRAGKLHAATALETGAPVPEAFSHLRKTVDDLFDVAEEAIRRRADGLEVQYDATWGYPTRIYIDYSFDVIDDEITYRAQNLHPLR